LLNPSELQVYIQKLRVRDVGTFVDATIELNVTTRLPRTRAPSNVTVIVGDNAVGKSTVLRAIALVALAALAATGAIPSAIVSSMVRRPRRSRVSIARVDGDVVRGDGEIGHVAIALHRRRSGVAVAHPVPRPCSVAVPSFVVGYGATRDMISRSVAPCALATAPYAQVASLFEPHAVFPPPAAWLGRLARANPARHHEALTLLRALAGPGDELLRSRSGAVRCLGARAFSDGQRAHIAWVTDTIRAASASVPRGSRLEEARGLVLVDQIEQHVHTRWLARLVPTIARALPKVQFVVTTHSPIVVGSVWRSNVVVLESPGANACLGTTIARPSREVFGLSVDQLLAMGVFGETSARNGEVADEIQSTARTARDGDAESALRLLRLLALGGAAIDDSARRRDPTQIAGAP
jgi:hypothetical protein